MCLTKPFNIRTCKELFNHLMAYTCALFLLVPTALKAQGGRKEAIDTTAVKSHHLQEVEIQRKRNRAMILKQPFAVDAIDAGEYAAQNVNFNRLLDQAPGLRVRESGGFGSETAVSIHGISGRGIKFFLDGIPMDYMGGAFFINNFPVNVIDRVDIYKGVVPIALGGDALGGAINIVSRAEVEPYLNLSYALGSFGTHRASVSGRAQTKKGFVLQGNFFYNQSKNNYEVWGPGVEIPDEFGRPIDGFRAKRFNDDYTSYLGKVELGWTQQNWADKLLFGVNVSGLERGIQHGRTMAYVYGRARYEERGIMPTLQYSKANLWNGKLDVDVFGMYSNVDATTTDTSSNRFNWAGEALPSAVQGELSSIYSRKSIYHFYDRIHLWRAYSTLRLNEQSRLRLAWNGQWLGRRGKDDLNEAEWTIPLREPQQLNKNYIGLSYERDHGSFTHIVSAKGFYYDAESFAYSYQGNAQKQLIPLRENGLDWGVGYAGKYTVSESWMLKASAERSIRIPEGTELFGDGTTLLNAPGLKPEKSYNANLSTHWDWSLGATQKLQLATAFFFRDTRDLLWLGEADHLGTARYENLSRILAKGFEINANYNWGALMQLAVNYTLQDVRNRQRENSLAPYNARMKNMPVHLANAYLRLRSTGGWLPAERASFYLSTHYVHEYALFWPALGSPDQKNMIPTQFVQDMGISYRVNNPLTVALDCQNILDRQVYDNFMLQKPGRFLSVKLQYHINPK